MLDPFSNFRPTTEHRVAVEGQRIQIRWLASKLYRVRARYHRRSGTPCALLGFGTCRMAAP